MFNIKFATIIDRITGFLTLSLKSWPGLKTLYTLKWINFILLSCIFPFHFSPDTLLLFCSLPQIFAAKLRVISARILPGHIYTNLLYTSEILPNLNCQLKICTRQFLPCQSLWLSRTNNSRKPPSFVFHPYTR